MPPRKKPVGETNKRIPGRSKKTSLQATKTARGRPKEDHFHTLNELRRKVAQADDRRGDAIYEAIEGAIIEAELLQNDTNRWTAFTSPDRWGSRNQKPQCVVSDALPFALLWALNYDRRTASKAKCAVAPLYAQDGLTAAEIVRRIRLEGGYEKVAQANAKSRRPNKSVLPIIHLETLADGMPGDLSGYVVQLHITTKEGRAYMARYLHHQPWSDF